MYFMHLDSRTRSERAISHAPFSSTFAGAEVPFSEDGNLTKEQRKARLVKMVVGKDRLPEEPWRSGESTGVLNVQ